MAKLKKKEKIVFVTGNFNILHPGHIRLLSFAKECGDNLIVGLYDDESVGVILPYDMRCVALNSLHLVQQVIKINKDNLKNILLKVKPDILVKGREHESKYNFEEEVVRTYGGQLIFCSGDAIFSSEELLKKEYKANSNIISHDLPFLDRHGTNLGKLKLIIDKFVGVKAMTLGEVIIDEYIECSAVGMSQEDPTLVVTPIKTNKFIGGAGIVAGHLKGLSADSLLMTVTGDDPASQLISSELAAIGVNATIINDGSRPTISKQRYRASNKTLLRVNNLRSHDISHDISDRFYLECEKHISNHNLLVFSDFNYGCLPQHLVDRIVALCNEKKLKFIADSQSSSQIGDISRYVGGILISATEREARIALSDFKSGLQDIANRLLFKSKAKYLLLKLGADGVIVMDGSDGGVTDRLPAMNSNPVDVAGAGDAMLVVTGMALVCGASIWESAYLGSMSAALQVSRNGNIPLSSELFYKYLY